jgi:hypothetical protein
MSRLKTLVRNQNGVGPRGGGRTRGPRGGGWRRGAGGGRPAH